MGIFDGRVIGINPIPRDISVLEIVISNAREILSVAKKYEHRHVAAVFERKVRSVYRGA